ncbi:MAG: hypothetical protein DDT39_01713 [Firmicutes bacterium]|nr:hypothetical protein [candidate division NPL-UPA2 bacterium]
MDKFLGRTLGVAALLAGAGVFYHYVIHLPGLEREKKAEKAAAAESLAEQQQQRASQYQLCIYTAQQNYDYNWAEACTSVAAENTRDLKNCLATPSIVQNEFMGRQWCEKQYGDIDPSPNCSLPGKRADGVNEYHAEALKQCELAAKLGV